MTDRAYGASALTDPDDEMPSEWTKVEMPLTEDGRQVWIAPLDTGVPDTDRKISASHREDLTP